MRQSRSEYAFYRNRRSKLKAALRRGSILPRKILRKFHLDLTKHTALRANVDLREFRREKVNNSLPIFEIKVPKILCLIKNTDESVLFLNNLKTTLNEQRNIFINHENTEYLGLAASHIFDEIITFHKLDVKKHNLKFYLSGKTSRFKKINNFLLAIGFFNKIDLPLYKIKSGVDIDYSNKYASYGRKGTKFLPYLKGNAATGLTGYLDKCLNFTGKKVTELGFGKLSDAISEIIGNAEEHVPNSLEWHVVGCYEKESCTLQFAIINSGSSIFETLSSSESTAQKDIEEIKDVIEKQKSHLEKIVNFFLQNPNWEEPVWNVMALQEGISSKRYENLADARNRGQGLMDFLEFIKEASSNTEDRVISILSGRSHILIDFKKYDITKKLITSSITGEQELRRRICFNAENDLKKPQDKEYVSTLNHKFEGTVITGIIKIADKFIQAKRN